LNQCIILCNASNDEQRRDYLDTARVLLAYVWLEKNSPTQVVHLADQMLNGKPLSSTEDKNVYVNSMRQRATMRLYACEALSLMGHPSEAQNYLSDPELNLLDNDCNTLLAAQLTSVDMTKKKQLNQGELKRMNHAKASIQISSANANLATGNVESAEKEARSACVILANDEEGNVLRVAAQKTLVESLICGGKVSEAVKVAKSLK
jgi:hypothetical protein